jgi:ferredoxin-NADP reductase
MSNGVGQHEITGPGGARILRVARAWPAADGVMCYILADRLGGELPSWTPGAHVDVHLPSAMTRQYSLSGDPADRRHWRIAVLLEEDGRGGSRYLHHQVKAGSELLAGVPRNNFPLVNASRYVFIAGGIGITALLPMIAAAQVTGTDWQLHYGARSRARMAFTHEVARYGDRCRLYPQDTAGLMPLDTILGPAADGAAVYCCGPEPLLRAVEQRQPTRRSGSLHVERFRPRDPDAAGADADDGFDVVLNNSGTTVRVAPGQSILAALTTAGIGVPSSCQEGTCASCETGVIEGEVEHLDSVLSDEERAAGRTMMLCVSRARSPRLVLDL